MEADASRGRGGQVPRRGPTAVPVRRRRPGRVAHKPSDTRAVGAEGSEADRIARDLLHLADTKVLFGQDQAVGDELGDLLGLSPIAQDIVTGWGMAARGRALWIVGDRKYKVSSVRHPLEEKLTFTNDALAG